MNIDDLLNMWAEDSDIDKDDLSGEVLHIPKLHGKYYKLYIQEKMKLIKLQEDKKRLVLDKHDYYRGIMPIEEVRNRGWEPWQITVLKQELQMYIDADQHVIDLNLKIAIAKEKVDMLESFIKNLSMRGYNIKTAVDFIRFRAGN